MAEKIVLPVSLKLEGIQASINELQGALNRLEPNTAAFKNLEKIINGMRGSLEKLQVQTSKSFNSQAQFNQAEKTIEKLEDSFNRAQLAINNLKFSDIKLDSEQLASFQQFESELKKIEKRFEEIKNTAKQQILSNDKNVAALSGIDINLLDKNFDEITKRVEQRFEALNNKVYEAQNRLSAALLNSTRSEQATRLTSGTSDNVISEAFLGSDVFEQFFRKTEEGLVGFKGGKAFGGKIKQAFVEALKQEFNLGDEVDSLVDLTFAQLNQAFKNGKFNELFSNWTSKGKFEREKTNAQTGYNQLVAEQTAVSSLRNELNAMRSETGIVGQAEQQMYADIEQLNNGLSNFKQRTIEATRENINLQNSFNAGQNALNIFSEQLEQANGQFLQLQRSAETFNSLKMAVSNFMGFNQVLDLTKRAIQEAAAHIQRLDSIMNNIAIVTGMKTSDLWNQIDTYSNMAQSYGVTIEGTYEVSQIFYQMGLETNDVMNLTNETLKLSKISGLDYATTTDYMTTALRGFRMEMTEASTVTDVYSALAANTAVSQEELAEAMTRTASSMQSIGSTFQEASSMIATMVAATRESANNIGSALKSIASRYGELTKDPTALVDSEGEAMSFNRVDEALQSVGISMKTVDGQFRSFSEVITELGEKWDSLENSQQRFIATQFAGNRQQNRFLALVSNIDEYKKNLEVALDSEDIGDLQTLASLDSLESKINQVQVAYQQFYTSLGAESLWRTALDGIKNYIDTLNGLPKVFGKIPLNAIAIIGNLVGLVKNVLYSSLQTIASTWQNVLQNSTLQAEGTARQGSIKIGQTMAEGVTTGIKQSQEQIATAMQGAVQNGIIQSGQYKGINVNSLQGLNNDIISFDQTTRNLQADQYLESIVQIEKTGAQFSDSTLNKLHDLANAITAGKLTLSQASQQAIQELTGIGNSAIENTSKISQFWATLSDGNSKVSRNMTTLAQSFSLIGMAIDKSSAAGRTFSGILTGLGGSIQTFASAARVLSGDLTALPGLAMGILNIFNGISIAWEDQEEKLKRLNKEAEDLSNTAKQVKNDYKTLNTSIKKYEELKEKRYESAEAAEEYQTVVDELASKFPEMIDGFDTAGDAIVYTINSEETLANARLKSAQATYEAAKAELAAKQQEEKGQQKEVKNATDSIMTEIISQINELNLYGPNLTAKRKLGTIAYMNPTQDMTEDAWLNLSNNPDYNFLRDIIQYETHGIFTTAELTEEMVRDAINGPERQEWIRDYPEQIALIQQYFNEAGNSLSDQLSEISSLANSLRDMDPTDPNFKTQLINFREKIKLIDEQYFNGERFEWLIAPFEDLFAELNILDTFSSNVNSSLRRTISGWINTLEVNGKPFKFLEESTELNAFAIRAIETDVGDRKWEDYINSENNAINILDTYQNFWNSLESTQKKLFQRITSDTASYTAEDIIKTFSIDSDSEIAEIIRSYYEDAAKSINERIRASWEKKKEKGIEEKVAAPINDFLEGETDFSADEESYFYTLTDILLKLSESNFNTKAENVSNAGIAIFGALNTINEKDAELSNTILDLILKNGLTTVEGLESSIKAIQGNDALDESEKKAITSQLAEIAKNIVQNFALSIQTSISDFGDSWKKDSTEINKLFSGMTISEVSDFLPKAQALGVEISQSDFIVNGEKLILANEKFNEFWLAYEEQLEARVEDWIKISDDIKTWPEKGQLNQDFINDWMKYGHSLEDLNILLTEIGFDISDKSLYALDTGIFTENGFALLSDAIVSYIQNINNLNWLMDSASTTINQARDKQLKSTYDTLISDVLSKGFDDIDLNDYSILPDDIDLSGSYADFVKKYASSAGKTIEETNSLIIDAIEKDSQSTIGITDAFKDVTFINENIAYASLNTLQSIADSLGKDVLELFDPNNYNSVLGGYKVDLSKINLNDITNIKEMITDSINNYINSIADLISKGLSGSLTNIDITTLKGQLKTIGLGNIELDFNKTAEGLRLSRESAIELYAELQKINSIAALTVFNELQESLEAAGEDCENITKTMASIKSLEIEMGKHPDNAKLQERLDLYSRIAAVQMQNPDQYDFMGRNLPDYLKGPENYWNSIGEAFTAMEEAASSGYIGVTDFYNIVNEMNNLAALGSNIELLGMTLDGSLESASALIQKGMNALSNVDGAGVKINLEEFGVDMAEGADMMSGNIEEGIDAMAQSQIDMLDGMIALLETVVAMEGLSDVAGEDMIISLGELFITDPEGNIITDESGKAKYEDKYQKFANTILTQAEGNEVLASALQQVKIKGYTLQEIFEDATDSIKDIELSETDYLTAVQSLYNMYLSGDYKLEDIMASIIEVANSSDFTGEIEIDGRRFAIGQGYYLEAGEDDKWHVGTQTFDNLDEALKAYQLQALGGEEFTYNKELDVMSSSITLAQQKVIINIDKNSEITYYSESGELLGNSRQEALQTLYNQAIKDKEIPETTTYTDWVIQQEGEFIAGEIKVTDTARFQARTREQVQDLANKLVSGNAQEIKVAAGEIGINVELTNGTLTADQLNQISLLAGIESKTAIMDITANLNGEAGPALANALEGKAIDVTLNIKKGTDETGLINNDDAATTLTKEIAGITIAKAAGFTVTGEDTIWAEITSTKEYDTFTAYVTKLITEKGNGFTSDSSDAIWAEIKDSKEYQQFVATVKSLVVKKIATGFTSDDGSAIWGEIIVTKEFDEFVAIIKALTINKDNEYSISGIDAIWSDVVTTKEYDAFTATVAKILVSKAAEGFTIDESAIWAEVATTNEYASFIAYVAKVIVEKTAQGFTVNDAAIWAEVKDSKEYEEFTATVSSIVAEKAATGFVDKTAEILPDGPIRVPKDVIVEVGKVTVEDSNSKLRNNVYMGLYGDAPYKYLDPQRQQVQYEAPTIEYNWLNQPYNTTETRTKDVFGNNTEVINYLNSLRDIVNQGQILSQLDLSNLDKLRSTSGRAETENGETIANIIQGITALNQINLQTQVDQMSLITEAFSGIDAANLQACADAMSQLESSANSVMNINWDALVGNINAINTPSADNNIVSDGTTIMRDISASVVLNYTDAIAEELLKNPSITRTVVLTAETSGIQEALSNLSANVKVNSTGGANTGNATPTVVTPTATGGTGIASVFSGAFSAIKGALTPVTTAINTIANGGAAANTTLSKLASSMQELPTDAAGTVNTFADSMNGIPNTSGRVYGLSRAMSGIPSNAASRIVALNEAISKIPSRKTINIMATVKVNATGGRVTNQTPTSAQPVAITAAKGNIALAGGRKKTLMGELGAELVVSNGHYYLVGQNGAEMVDLPDDAIVFNHLQTKQLLSSGMSGRGKAVTNERNATSMATGNVEGPAMASAAAALSALKQIRAMWQAMLDASLKDLGQQAGSGGGGGGGGKDKNTIDPGFIADLERWYNLLRQIERLEKSINYEEKLRQKLSSDTVSNGKAYYESQKRSLDALQQQIVKNEELSYLQKSYYDARRQDLAQTNFGKIFTFDENGLMQYNDTATMANGDKGGLFALAKINAQNADNSPVYTAQEQYNLLKQWGFDEELKYDNEGNLIEWTDEEGKARDEAYTEAVQAFWDKIDGWKDELDGLYDSYNDSLNDLLDEEAQRNEILNEMRDNQLNLEQKIVKAIENREQKQIDDLQDERDALEDATSAYIDGLNNQLERERQMYQHDQEEQELNKLRRQLAILQRSGGSAAQIRSLQNQISAKEQDAYFNAQQTQIDAIQEASDKEMETLNAQLDVMKESLEYQKENGLLWREVSEVMKGTPAEIETFLATWSPDFQGVSPTDFNAKMEELKSIINQWVQRRDDENDPLEVDRQDEAGVGWRVWATENQGHYQKIWNEKSGAAEKAYRDAYAINSNPIEAAAAARKVLDQALTEYYQLHPEEDPKNKDNQIQLDGTGDQLNKPSESTGGGTSTKPSTQKPTVTLTNTSDWKSDSNYHWKIETYSNGTTKTIKKTKHNKNKKINTGNSWTCYCSVCNHYMGIEYKTSSTKNNVSGGCFVAGTKIIMGDNSIKNIEDVLDNEFVLAYNTKTGIFEPYRVIKSYPHFNTPRVIDITLSDGTVLGITPGHPILTTDGWKSRDQAMSLKEHEVATKWLELGDEVLQYGKKASIIKIEERDIPEHYVTYNLWIDKCHTYIADGVIVHNAAPSAQKKKIALSGFSAGGLADYTGLAMVHGSKKRPEAFLNADETKMWKDDILSGRKGSLTNSLIKFQDMVEEMTASGVSGNTTNNNGNIIIEHAEVNVDAEVANDYDARRIGQNALEEMVKIARKSSAQSIRR